MHPPHQPQNISLVFYVEVSNFKDLLSILSVFLLFKVILHEIVLYSRSLQGRVRFPEGQVNIKVTDVCYSSRQVEHAWIWAPETLQP